jgi:hypothetical protein
VGLPLQSQSLVQVCLIRGQALAMLINGYVEMEISLGARTWRVAVLLDWQADGLADFL